MAEALVNRHCDPRLRREKQSHDNVISLNQGIASVVPLSQ